MFKSRELLKTNCWLGKIHTKEIGTEGNPGTELSLYLKRYNSSFGMYGTPHQAHTEVLSIQL